MFHCFFEQSGTFKREFAKLGFKAEDYDILNQFNETDHVIDLFEQINKAYDGQESIFDSINPETDQILAFFPCVRFEAQIIMNFRGDQFGSHKWSLERKLEYDLQLHDELHELYVLITKFALVCLRKGIKCIIENPYATQHYLVRYWACRAAIIDTDRSATGDYFEKPTQYFFLNREPSNNFIFEAVDIKKKRKIVDLTTVDRSMIAPDYANRFIREYVLSAEEFEACK